MDDITPPWISSVLFQETYLWLILQYLDIINVCKSIVRVSKYHSDYIFKHQNKKLLEKTLEYVYSSLIFKFPTKPLDSRILFIKGIGFWEPLKYSTDEREGIDLIKFAVLSK